MDDFRFVLRISSVPHLFPRIMRNNIRTYLNQPKPIGIDDNTQLIHLFSKLKSDPSAGLHVIVPSQPRTDYEDMLSVSVQSSPCLFLDEELDGISTGSTVSP